MRLSLLGDNTIAEIVRERTMGHRRTVTAIAAGALAVTGLAGFAAAAQADDETNNSTTPESSNGATSETDDQSGEGEQNHERKGRGPGGHSAIGKDMLHGEIVVETQDGAVQTQLIQRGEVTNVSATAITVESSDGFSQTYTIDADTTQQRDRADGTAQVGDTVHVLALDSGSAVIAENIKAMSAQAQAEFEQRRADMEQWMADRPEGAGKPGKPGQRGGPGQGQPSADAA